MTKTVQYQNELHKFLIWDTAGQERVSNIHWRFGLSIFFLDRLVDGKPELFVLAFWSQTTTAHSFDIVINQFDLAHSKVYWFLPCDFKGSEKAAHMCMYHSLNKPGGKLMVQLFITSDRGQHLPF